MTKSFLGAILVLVLASAALKGGLIAPQSIFTLQQTADLIVNASASQITQHGVTVNLSLNVSRVIKGDPGAAGTSIAAFWESGDKNAIADITGGGGLWFLKSAGTAWRVIPVVQGSMQLSNVYFPAEPIILSAYLYGPAASLTDKLASEISSAIETGNGHGFQMYAVQSGLLDELQSPVVGVLYGRMANSTSAEHKLVGLAGLIRSGNTAALSAAIQMAPTLPADRASGILLLSIRDHFRATDANSVTILGVTATDTSNSNIAFREAAGHALAAIHTAAALPFLAALLDDPDTNLRVEAVGGMGAFANGLGVQTNAGGPSLSYLQLPASAPYKTQATIANLAFGVQAVTAHETAYISFWKSWWTQNRAGIGY